MPNPTLLTDIEAHADVVALVDAFYTSVRADDLLGPVFHARIGAAERWPAHLRRMYAFWNTLLFHEAGYKGSPYEKHAQLTVNDAHFERWVSLFGKTVDARFLGPRATDAKARAELLGVTFASKLKWQREQG